MSFRVLVVPDKFKGTLTAHAAAGAICNGWWHARPADELEILPMSDGGDGFGEIMAALLEAEERTTTTVDAAGRPLEATWWFSAKYGVALIESARIVGLALLPAGRFHPFDLDTRGLAAVVRDAVAAGAARCLIGIGGSATNDGGFGVARALGWGFIDATGKPIERWVKLGTLDRLIPPPEPVGPSCEFIVAVDVDNPLLGLNGCSHVYGPQKGLLVQQMPIAEAALERLTRVVHDTTGTDVSGEPGSGAAGGLGYGLRVFLNARVESGFELFAQQSDLDAKIAAADLVITGEGSIDRQSLMGKGTGRIALRCRAHEKRCLALAGVVDGAAQARTPERLFHTTYAMAPTLTSPTEARNNAALWLERLAAKAAAEYDG